MPTINPREVASSSMPVEPKPMNVSSQPSSKTSLVIPEVSDPAETIPALEAPKQEQLSPRYLQLARKEKALREQQRQIAMEKEAMKAKLAEYETSYIPKSKLTEMAKNNPLRALEQMGLTPDEFTQALLQANPQEAAIQKIMERLESIENGQKQTMTQLETQQQEAYKQAVTQIRNDIKLIAESDNRFETIKEADAKGWQATEGAVSLIETIFNEGWPEKKLPKGTIINNEKALEYVQDWVKEKAYEMAQLKGVKERFSPSPTPTPETPKALEHPRSASQAAKTLSNAMNATKTNRLSDKERRERAILAFSGQL